MPYCVFLEPIVSFPVSRVGAWGCIPVQISKSQIVKLSNYQPEEDTLVIDRNYLIMNYTGRECDVSPYHESYDAITNVPIVTAARAWTCQVTGQTYYLLVFHEALAIQEQDHTLVNPNQLRAYGTEIQDNPFAPTAMHVTSPEEAPSYLYLLMVLSFTLTQELLLHKTYMTTPMYS